MQDNTYQGGMNMGKAEQFIREHTRNCTNYTGVINKKTCEQYYYSWLTPDQARKAVEIARDEMMEDITMFLEGAHEYTDNKVLQMQYDNEGLIRDFREFVRNKIMKDE